jgi:hypothetical protein
MAGDIIEWAAVEDKLDNTCVPADTDGHKLAERDIVSVKRQDKCNILKAKNL